LEAAPTYFFANPAMPEITAHRFGDIIVDFFSLSTTTQRKSVVKPDMPLEQRRSHTIKLVAITLSTAAIIMAPLFMGGISPHMTVIVSLPAFLAGLLCFGERLHSKRRIRISWFLLLPALGIFSSLLMLIPLPDSVLMFLAPTTTDRVQWVTMALAEEHRALVRPVLSVAPPLTALSIVRLSAGSAIFFVYTAYLRNEKRRIFTQRLLLAGYCIVFTVALAHQVLSIPHIWGLFPPSGNTVLYGPMINPNHMTRLHGAYGLLFAARALTCSSRTERLWFSFGSALGVVGAFASLSRGGILCLVVAALFLGWLKSRDQADRHIEPSSAKKITLKDIAITIGRQIAALSTISAILYIARDKLVTELGSLADISFESSKTGLYDPALRLINEYWLLGVSNGGFGHVFPSVLKADEWTSHTFTHIENIFLQTVLDHGLFLGSILLGCGFVALVTILHRVQSRKLILLLPALFFLILAEIFDFFLETSAGLFLCLGILGLISAHLVAHRRTMREIKPIPALVIFFVLIVTVPWSAWIANRDGIKAMDHEIKNADPDAALDLLSRAMALYPQDGFAAYRLSALYRQRGDFKNSLQWANRSLILWPNLHSAHMEAARSLVRLGLEDQALIEYKLAWLGKKDRRIPILREVSRLTPSVEKRKRILPKGDTYGLSALCTILEREKRLEDAKECYVESIALNPTVSILTRAVSLAIQMNDKSTARARLDRIESMVPLDGKLAQLRVRVYRLEHGFEAAFDESEKWGASLGDPKYLYAWRLNIATRLNRLEDAFMMIKALKNLYATTREQESLMYKESQLYTRQGSIGNAIKLLDTLLRQQPESIRYMEDKVRLELQIGAHTRAIRSVRNILRIDPDHAKAQQWKLEIEKQILNRLPPNPGQ
jgi:tetratricopeptide (TPR) repeat protein